MAIDRKALQAKLAHTLKLPVILAILLGGTGFALLLTWLIQRVKVSDLRQTIRSLPPEQVQPQDRLALETETLTLETATYTTLLHTLIIIALGGLSYVLWHYLRASAQQRIADQVSLSVEQLGHDKTEVRLGGIYTLLQIAKTHPSQHSMVIDILSAFVRERSRLNPSLPNDVQMALKALVSAEVVGDLSLDLTGATLPGARLQGAHLPAANFEDANLQSAKLHAANLAGATLLDANLHGAKLEDCNLEAAQLQRANLESAHFVKANLERSDLQLTNLKGANLQEANLEAARLLGASLQGANLQGVILKAASLLGTDLSGANLQGADLQGANLLGANLEECDLQGANLTGTKLQGANLQAVLLQGATLLDAELQGVNLKGAKYDQKTQFPESITLPKRPTTASS